VLVPFFSLCFTSSHKNVWFFSYNHSTSFLFVFTSETLYEHSESFQVILSSHGFVIPHDFVSPFGMTNVRLCFQRGVQAIATQEIMQ